MTKPRCVNPNVTYLVTRRCSERRFFLRPDPEVAQMFEYLLGLLATRHGIQVHAYVVMSNHYHLVATDVRGVMPDFQRDLNSLLARAVNAFRGRWESLWDRQPGGGALGQPGAAVGGATSAGMVFGRARRIARPRRFFTDDNLPDVVELEIVWPKCCDELGDREVLARVNAEVSRREDEHAKAGKAMGMARVMAQDWNDSPRSFEPRRELAPRIAGKSKWARIEAIQRSQEWLVAYYEALARFVSGEREVEFPRGTWRMHVRLGCRVALESIEAANRDGVWTSEADRSAKRFFTDDNLPDVVELEIVRPKCCDELGDREVLVRVNAEVSRREDEHARTGKAMGMARVMAQDWNDSPDSFELRRELAPRIAGKSKWARIEAIQRSQEWLVAYYEALVRFVSGEREVEFPRGTWRMRVRLGCRVALE